MKLSEFQNTFSYLFHCEKDGASVNVKKQHLETFFNVMKISLAIATISFLIPLSSDRQLAGIDVSNFMGDRQ